jgi:hypothetical protein
MVTNSGVVRWLVIRGNNSYSGIYVGTLLNLYDPCVTLFITGLMQLRKRLLFKDPQSLQESGFTMIQSYQWLTNSHFISQSLEVSFLKDSVLSHEMEFLRTCKTKSALLGCALLVSKLCKAYCCMCSTWNGLLNASCDPKTKKWKSPMTGVFWRIFSASNEGLPLEKIVEWKRKKSRKEF